MDIERLWAKIRTARLFLCRVSQVSGEAIASSRTAHGFRSINVVLHVNQVQFLGLVGGYGDGTGL